MTQQNIMKIGQRIYYTGDMANQDGHGQVFAIRPETKWSPLSYDLRIDDGREFLGVMGCQFGNAPGDRFMTHEQWTAKREAQIAAMREARARLFTA